MRKKDKRNRRKLNKTLVLVAVVRVSLSKIMVKAMYKLKRLCYFGFSGMKQDTQSIKNLPLMHSQKL